MRKVVYIVLVFFVFGQQASNITPTSKETEKKIQINVRAFYVDNNITVYLFKTRKVNEPAHVGRLIQLQRGAVH